jgi:DnaK suppressor protein
MPNAVNGRDSARTASLRLTLNDLKAELLRDVQGRIRENRADRPTDVVDHVEGSDDDARQGLDLTLLEMRANTLAAIDAAIGRLDAGRYGDCVECDGPIAERRLRALPFAVRCRDCEEKRGGAPGRPRPDVERRSGASAIER